jgi:hypothetical protein
MTRAAAISHRFEESDRGNQMRAVQSAASGFGFQVKKRYLIFGPFAKATCRTVMQRNIGQVFPESESREESDEAAN